MPNVVDILIKAEDRASGTIDKVSGKLRKNLALGAAAAGAAMLAAGAASIKMAANFETAFAEVTTLFDAPKAQIASLREDVLSLSRDMGVDATEATRALYQAISAGVEPAQAVAFLTENVKLAVGGVTELSTAVDMTTTVMNAFGLAQTDLTRINDTLFTTVRLGKTTVDELGASLFNVAPIASAAGISIEEMGAALAVLTASGTRTSEATTQLRSAIESLVAPTIEQVNRAKDMGITFDAQAIATKGLQGAMTDLYDQTGGNLQQLRMLLGSTEAVKAVLVLAGVGADDFTAAMGAMENKAGATEVAFEKMNETFERQWAMLRSKLNVAMIELGTRLLPKVIEGMALAETAAGELKGAFEEWRPVLIEMAELLRDVGRALREFGEWIIGNQAALVTAIAAIGVALHLAFPELTIVAAIGGIIGAIALLRADLNTLEGAALSARIMLLEWAEAAWETVDAIQDWGKWLAFIPGPLQALGAGLWAAEKAGLDADKALRQVSGGLQEARDHAIYLESGLEDIGVTLSQFTWSMDYSRRTGMTLSEALSALTEQTIILNDAFRVIVSPAQATAQAYRAIAQEALLAGESVETFSQKLVISARMMAVEQNLLHAFELGAPAARLQEMIADLGRLKAELSALTVGVPELPGGAAPSPGATSAALAPIRKEIEETINWAAIAWHEGAIAWMEAVESGVREGSIGVEHALGFITVGAREAGESILDALVLEAVRTEQINRIIADTISRGVVLVKDVARLWELEAYDIAADFARALIDGLEETNIGAAIWQNAVDEAAEAGREAAEQFSQEFLSGWESAVSDLGSMIGGFPGRIGGLVGQPSFESIEERLRWLQLRQEQMDIERFQEIWQMGMADELAAAEEHLAQVRTESMAEIRDLERELNDRRRDAAQATAMLTGADRTLTAIVGDLQHAQEMGNTARIRMFYAELRAAEGINQDRIAEIGKEISAEEAAIAAAEGMVEALQEAAGLWDQRLEDLQAEMDLLEMLAERRRIEREIAEAEALLRSGLLQKDWEIIEAIEEETAALAELQTYMEILTDDVLDARDALALFALGMNDLAEMVLAIIAGLIQMPPSFELPGAAAGRFPALPPGVPAQNTYIDQIIIQGDPREGLAALGVEVSA